MESLLQEIYLIYLTNQHVIKLTISCVIVLFGTGNLSAVSLSLLTFEAVTKKERQASMGNQKLKSLKEY